MIPDNNFNKSLEDVLDLAPIKEKINEDNDVNDKSVNDISNDKSNNEIVVTPKDTSSNIPSNVLTQEDLNNDSHQIRDNLNSLINSGMKAIEELSEISRDSQSPRSYEVLAELIKTIGSINMNILDIHTKRKEVEDNKQSVNKGINVDKAIVFTGSTKDLIKSLKENI